MFYRVVSIYKDDQRGEYGGEVFINTAHIVKVVLFKDHAELTTIDSRKYKVDDKEFLDNLKE